MGWIHLARDRNVSGRWVVLKGLLNTDDAAASRAAISERRFLAEVDHPLIVQIHNFVVHEGAGYTVMEYVGGPTLKDILLARRERRAGPLPVDQALAYLLEVLPAFAYLHELDLLFCDFKPDNIIQQGDSVKLIDLGGVRRVDDRESPVYGTRGYRAPEVSAAGPSVAADIFTIGRTLAVLALDFGGNTTTYATELPPAENYEQLLRHPSLHRLLLKACATDPAERYATVDDLRVQMLGVLRQVVATERADAVAAAGRRTPVTVAAREAVTSPLFAAPGYDVPERPLAFDELPVLEVDPTDPMASLLAGVNVAAPADRLTALGAAPEQSAEVRLATVRAAIESGGYDHARELITELVADRPWEWRATWWRGVLELALERHEEARDCFAAVYAEVPGELAPLLALATTYELLGDDGRAEWLYLLCARTDANYAAPAAFGLARIRTGDVDGVREALDLVPPTRGSYVSARLARARALAGSGRGLGALDDALQGVAGVPLDPEARCELWIEVTEAALESLAREPAPPGASVGGIPAQERALRDAAERAYRDRAALSAERRERIGFVERANRVRNWSVW